MPPRLSLAEFLLIEAISGVMDAWKRLRQRTARAPCQFAEQADAIRVLERDGLLSAGEAHALRAGERLGDLYAEIAEAEEGVSADQLEEIESLIRLGALSEAVLRLGRLHPALRDLPDLFNRSARRGRA